jgi:hypothetical protein
MNDRRQPIRALVAYLWAWGSVVAYRESGGIGYPSLANIHGQRYRPIGGMSLNNLGAAFNDIERSLRQQPLLVRGLLYFQYGRPQLQDCASRSVLDYVDFVFGEGLTLADRNRISRVIRQIRRRWAYRASLELFGALPNSHPKGGPSQ